MIKMKIIERKIGEFFCEKVLRPIRNKQDVILLLLETLKLINDSEKGIVNERGRVIICIDKMSRVFYETNKKAFSICFPFSMEEKDEHYFRIYDSLTDVEITFQMISLLKRELRNSGHNDGLCVSDCKWLSHSGEIEGDRGAGSGEREALCLNIFIKDC